MLVASNVAPLALCWSPKTMGLLQLPGLGASKQICEQNSHLKSTAPGESKSGMFFP